MARPFCRRLVAPLVAWACVGTGCTDREEAQQVKRELAATKQSLAALEGEVKELRRSAARTPPPSPPRGPDPAKIYSVPIAGAPARGPADAWVTIVEFADFQCKFCGDGAATVAQLEAAYRGDVRLVFRHNPLSFHARALPAALAATCAAEQGKFWPVYDQLFAHTKALGGSDPQALARGEGMNAADLEAYAKQGGLRLEAFTACLSRPATKAQVDGDQALALRLGARGTPAFFINGRFLGGAQPLATFRALVDEELARAKASGTPRADYYARAVLAAGETAL